MKTRCQKFHCFFGAASRFAALAFCLAATLVSPAESAAGATAFAEDFNYIDRNVLSVELDMRYTLLNPKQVGHLKRQSRILFDLRQMPFPLQGSRVRLENSGGTLGEFIAKICEGPLQEARAKTWVRYISKSQVALFRLDALPADLRDVILEPGDCLVLGYVTGQP